jgi:hypothetical protein
MDGNFTRRGGNLNHEWTRIHTKGEKAEIEPRMDTDERRFQFGFICGYAWLKGWEPR